jgi:hypothetical protein
VFLQIFFILLSQDEQKENTDSSSRRLSGGPPQDEVHMAGVANHHFEDRDGQRGKDERGIQRL